MGEIVAVHSFRGGTGKTNLAANIAACIACKGKKVCIVDADVQSLGVHVLFGFEPERMGKTLNEGFTEVINALNLDFLFIDTPPGIGEEALLSLALADISLIVLRPDGQDYQGTSVTLEVCRRLDVPDPFLILNKVLRMYDFEDVKRDIESIYKSVVVGVLPQTDDLLGIANKGIFYLRQRKHSFLRGIEEIASRIISI